MNGFRTILVRDLRLALRQGTDAAMVVAFFIIAIVLFPLGLGPEPKLLARIAPGLIGVTALLSAMLSLERLFQQDYEDGSLELFLINPNPLALQVCAKIAAHWLTSNARPSGVVEFAYRSHACAAASHAFGNAKLKSSRGSRGEPHPWSAARRGFDFTPRFATLYPSVDFCGFCRRCGLIGAICETAFIVIRRHSGGSLALVPSCRNCSIAPIRRLRPIST